MAEQVELGSVSGAMLSEIEGASLMLQRMEDGDEDTLSRAGIYIPPLYETVLKLSQEMGEVDVTTASAAVQDLGQTFTQVLGPLEELAQMSATNPYQVQQFLQGDEGPILTRGIEHIAEMISTLLTAGDSDAAAIFALLRSAADALSTFVEKYRSQAADISELPGLVSDTMKQITSAKADMEVEGENGSPLINEEQEERLDEIIKNLQEVSESGNPESLEQVSKDFVEIVEELTA